MYRQSSVPENGFLVDEDYIVMTPTAPLTKVFTNYAGWDRSKDRCLNEGPLLFSAPIPNQFFINKNNWLGHTPNAGLAVLMADGRTIKQTQPFARCSEAGDAASQFVFKDQDIYGNGYYGAHGASGMSAIGGALRVGELIPGGVIRHVMKLNIYCHKNTSLNDDGSKGFRWPAVSADGYAGDCKNNPNMCYGGTNRAVEVGALVAIPAKLNIKTLSFETEPGKIMATAFQNYGAYLVDDTAWDVAAIVTEFGPHGRVIDEFKNRFGYTMETGKETAWGRDWAKILKNLHVVDNNTAATIGGGPTSDFKNRRAPMAPEFAVNKTAKILPKGNSLTQNSYPGYRGILYNKLVANKFKINFVGTKKDMPTTGGDADHSGYGGFVISTGASKRRRLEPSF